jgi:hypothetical protein
MCEGHLTFYTFSKEGKIIMAQSKNSNSTSSAHANHTVETETEVLYQNLGGQWFAFTIINDEVLMSAVDEAKVNEARRDGHTPGIAHEAL